MIVIVCFYLIIFNFNNLLLFFLLFLANGMRVCNVGDCKKITKKRSGMLKHLKKVHGIIKE